MMSIKSILFAIVLSASGLIQAAAPVGEIITLYSVFDAKYVSVDLTDGNLLNANVGSSLSAQEQFFVEDAGSGKILLKALCNNLYVQKASDVKRLRAVGTSATNDNNQWEWVEDSGGIIHLKNLGNGKYVKPHNGGTLKASQSSTNSETEFTWELVGSVASTWRVIPEDARWPTDDVIVAFCEVTDAEYNLPADPVNTDCTAAFQAAVDACLAGGGGTVFVPEGQYRLDGPLTIGTNVVLRGRWRELLPGDSGADLGTVIRCENETLVDGVINIDRGGAIDLTFWHPNQKPASGVTPYPWVIKTSGGAPAENLTFLNAYNAVFYEGSSMASVKGLYGSPLNTGISTGPAFAVPRFRGLNFSPDYLAWSGLETDPAELNAHSDYMYNNGTAAIHDGLAAFYCENYNISGYYKGVEYSNVQAVTNTPHGTLSNADISNCQMGLSFVIGHGVNISHCDIYDCLDAINTIVGSTIKMTYSSISGINYDVQANGFTVDVNMISSTWSGDPAKMNINGGTVYEESVRPGPTRLVYDDYVRKPLKEDLFNVKDYGALGNGVTDDTAAILAAVDDANANGGGIVFFPAGDYLIKQNLTLNSGVEIRGCSGGRRQIASSSIGSTLRIDVPVDEFGPAFITLCDNCGVRALGFFYPNQTGGSTSGDFLKYAYTVRGNGVRNYVINCSPLNPYRFVEFNGDDNLMQSCFPGGIRQIVQTNDNSNGRYEDNMAKPAYWPKSDFPCPLDKNTYKDNVVAEGLELIYMKNCYNYSMGGSFLHGGYRGVTIDNSSGDLGTMSLEQVEQGYAFINGSKHTVIDCSVNCEGRVGPEGAATESFGVKLFEGFKGSVECYKSSIAGEPHDAWAVESGSLYIQNGSVGAHQHGAISTLRIGANGSVFLEKCGFGALYGIENEGSLKMLNCKFGDGIYNAYAEEFGADNTFGGTNILSDPGQNPIRNYDLVLDPAGIDLVRPSLTKTLTYAATTNNEFNFTVDDPDFLNDSPNTVYLHCDWKIRPDTSVDPNTIVEIWFYGENGWTFDQSKTFGGSTDTRTKFILTNPAFGQQRPGEDYPDVRIVVVQNNSPLMRAAELRTAVWEEFAPKSPTGLAAAGGSAVALDWDDNAEPGVTYNVYRRETSSGAFGTPLATGRSVSNFNDDTAVIGTTYWYVVTAVDLSGRESCISQTVSSAAEADSTPPAAPTGLVATSGIGTVSLDWADNGESDLASYNVYRSTTSGGYGTTLATGIPGSSSAYVDNTADNATFYYYAVTAIDTSSNESGYSNEDSALPPDLTDDDIIDLKDLAEVASQWLTTYELDDLSVIAENWLVY